MCEVKHAEQPIGVSRSPSTPFDVSFPEDTSGRSRSGASSHPLYGTWKGMIRRCYATNAENYARYGGRGITVCDRWLNDFWAFVCDMGERPKDTTLDRKDNDANYEPGNCRWAVKIIQSVNRRSAAVEFAPGHNPCRFTPAEMLVLHEIGKGLRYSKVASNLEISTRTVEIHASRLLEKSGADCLFMLGVWYAKNFPERCA